MTFLYLKSDQMGEGDPVLGRKLLVSFLKTLVKNEEKIDFVSCINSAIKLTTQEGDALEALRTLEKRGSIIASCQTCLTHYNRKKQLKVGQVGSMDATVNLFFEADKIIQP